ESSNSGAVYVYRGTAFGLFPWQRLTQGFMSLASGDFFGYSLAAGDFNKDGLSDLAVGVPQSGNSRSIGGRVVLYTGGSRGLSANVLLEQSAPFGANEAGDEFGRALAAGDFDNDGVSDLAVGVPGEAPGSSPRAGYAYIFRGQLAASGPALVIWAGLR